MEEKLQHNEFVFLTKHNRLARAILLLLAFSVLLLALTLTVSSAPDGYCEEATTDMRFSTWITDVDYHLYPSNQNPESIKLTVELFFTTDGFGMVGSPIQPDPDCLDDYRYINAWIDWNGDCAFDSSEQVFSEELFWYDEAYQLYYLNSYQQGDPLEYLDVLTLPRDQLTGKSIRWLTYDSFCGGMGFMTVSKTLPLPESYADDTWMKINYGWLYNPQNPCDCYSPTYGDPHTSWEYGDSKYKRISTTPDLCINTSDISLKQKKALSFPMYDFKDSLLNVTVHNNGKTEAQNVEILLYKTDENQTIISSETKILPSIAAESSATITFEGNFDPYRFEDIVVEVDPENKIWEINKSNNYAQTYAVKGYVAQHNLTTTALPRTRVDIQQYDGISYKFVLCTVTDDEGFYKFWTNSEYLVSERQSYVIATLQYMPTRQLPPVIYVMNETQFGDNVLPNNPKALTSNDKLSSEFTLKNEQDSTHNITFSGVEGGLAYQTLITLYEYHKNQNTAPSGHVVVNINDNDGDAVNDNDAYAYQSSYTIHLPPGRQGTTDPFTIGHEFTHIVERGWLPTYYDHHPLVPVEEGSCHWGSCIARGDPVVEFEDGKGGFVTIDVSNNSHTSNSTPAPTSFVACREEFQIAGTMWDLNTSLVWHILRYGYGEINPIWPCTPLLFYDAYKEVDLRTSPVIKAIFKSHAYATKTWPGKDGLDPDFFTETFFDQAIDSDGDGKYESLQIGVVLDIVQPGDYLLSASIDETTLASSILVTLDAGINLVNLSFFGENIFESRCNGPYTLSFYLHHADNYSFVDNRISFYTTSFYDYTNFKRPLLVFTDNHTTSTVDDDSDGLVDQLILDVELNLTESSYVKMFAGLYCNDVFIDNCWGPSMNDGAVYEYVEAGTHNLSLFFNGESIYAAKQNGSYEVRTSLGNARDLQVGSFDYTDFEQPSAVLSWLQDEVLFDRDMNGYIDSLNLTIGVLGQGSFILTGHLYNESGEHLVTTHVFDDINTTQSLCLCFDGESLRNQRRNGVYDLSVELYDSDGFFLGYANYVLSPYSFDDFEPSDEDVFSISYSDYGVDNSGGPYGYETLCIDMVGSSLISGWYQIEGYLRTEDGVMLSSTQTDHFFDESTTSVTLCFDGQVLGSSYYNGTYTLDVLFINQSRIVELKDVYTTDFYTYDGFESTYLIDTADALYSTGGLHPVANKLGVTLETYSTVPRYVWVFAQLRDCTDEIIDEATIRDIWAYENDSTLILFDGGKINDHGVDGPFTVDLWLYDEQDNSLDRARFITDYYDSDMFSAIGLTGFYSDYGLDLDSNSFYDYLVIEAEVSVALPGFCTIEGTLEDDAGQSISTTQNTQWLPEGMQTLLLYFNGSEISAHGVDGLYTLSLVSVYHNKDVSLTDMEFDCYQSQTYFSAEFDLTASTSPNLQPVSIATGPSAGSIGDAVRFNASASYDPEGSALSYHWDFGDGATSTQEQPIHTYTSDGIYTVSLVVNDGQVDSTPDSFILCIGYPVADAQGPYTAYGQAAVQFNASASYDPEGLALSYYWDFGDGFTSNTKNPMHTYSSYGTYTATLTVNDGTFESTGATTVTVLQSLIFDDEPTDSGLDINGDGLYEYLLIEVDATNYIGQNISTEVSLTDSVGTILSYGLDTQFLNISSYTLSLYFDGPSFFENRVPGPYFVEITTWDNESEILESLNYATTAYEYTDFQFNTKIDTVVDAGIDADGNGLHDYLSANVTLINYANRDITLQATLLDSNGTSIDSVQETRPLTANTTIQLLFDGKTIYSHGENGPYTISLILKNEYDQIIDLKESTTSGYQYTDFEEVLMSIWTVDDDDGDIPNPPADFSTIQDAIDAASNGDVIQIYAGTYYENIDLNKSLTLLGFDRPCIDADWYGHGIDITADHCNIEGFEFKHAYMGEGDPDVFTSGIYIQSHNNIVLNNIFDNNENGITIVESNDNVIDSNDFTSIDTDLILLSADRNTIKNNAFLEDFYGILIFEDSSDNIIYLNKIGKQYENAIDLTMNNSWNSSIPVSYEYDGIEYVGYVGNYWNDHISIDIDHNGVFDTPYTSIAGPGYAIDYYPMVGNWPPTADANGPYYAESGQDIQFNSSGSIDPEGETLTYYWDFLDGNTSTEANPTHAYVTSDRLKLYPRLNVSDGVYTDADTATVYINYPIAVAGGPYYALEGESVTLDGSASYDPLGSLYKYYWIPDASGYSSAWSISSKKYVRYNSEGVYEPRLSVWSMATGTSVLSSFDYTVVYVNDTDPIPDFTSNQQSGMAPLSIDFEDLSDSYDGITLWEWDFDNDGIIDVSGTDDAAQNPSFTYSATGVYSVNLTVHEEDGDMVSMLKTDYISVTEPRPPITIYVPDEYPTIQEAIDAGTTLDGDIIVVRDGVFRQNIIVSKELTIKSDNGSDHCQLFPQYNNDHMILINSNNVTIFGFSMNGTGYSYASLCCDGFENITIKDNWINDTGSGIIFEDVIDARILNNIMENCSKNPLYGYRISNVSIIGNSFSNGGDEGAEFSHMDNCTIKNNTAFGNRYSGIVIGSGNDNVLVGNNLNGNGVPGHSSYEDCGLRILSGHNYHISNNTMNNNSEYGLFLDSSSNIVYNNTMKENKYYDLFTDADNVVYSNIGSGDKPIIYANTTTHIEDMVVSEIILIDADYSVLSNVTIDGSDALRNNGIYTRFCDNVQFTDVTSSHNYRGINMRPTIFYVYVGQENNTFTNCTFNDNRFDGVKICGDGNKIENCDISYNQNYGVYVYEFSDSTIVNSTINNNSWSGIYLRVDNTVLSIDNNTITGNSWGIYCTSGDYLGSTEGNVTIEYNLLSNNTADGIRIAYAEHFNSEGDHLHTYLIQHNTILDNDDCGLSTEVEYADLQISMNTIAGNDWGISCENTYWDQNPHVNITYNTILENNNGISITKINDHQNTYLLSDNCIQDNSINGIYISPVSGTINIINNLIVQSSNGISCINSYTSGVDSKVTIDNNILSENDDAISINDMCSEHDYVAVNNIINNNSIFGILLTSVSGNMEIINNMICYNEEGIYSENSNTYANISHNIISDNEKSGINTNHSDIQFLIYDNIIVSNTVNDIGNSKWNNTKTAGENIVGGPYLGGNYWSAYNGSDTDLDYLGDTFVPHNSSGCISNGGDYHPLILPQELVIAPIANQTMLVESKRSVGVYSLSNINNIISLFADNLPAFASFYDQGNGMGKLTFQPNQVDSGEYTITINATDGMNIATETFILSVMSAGTNQPPIANAGGPYTLLQGMDLTVDGSGSYDLDDAIVSFQWDLDNDGLYDDAAGATPTISSATTMILWPTPGTYTIALKVEDEYAAFNTDTTTLQINAPNQPPTANAGGPYSGDTGTPIVVDGSNSYDIDGTIVSYEWDFDNDGLYDDATGVSITYIWDSDGSHTISLRVTDDEGATDTDTAVVTTSNPNIPPVADAGGPYSVVQGTDLTLDGSGSYDSDDSIVSFQWDLDNDGQYDDATGQSPIISGATGITLWPTSGQYTIGLEVTDTFGEQNTNQTTVDIIKPNQLPIADAGGPYTGQTGLSITLDGSGSVDPDGAIVSYEWDLDNDGLYDDAFGVGPAYAWTTDGTHIITLKVTDNNGTVGFNQTTVFTSTPNLPPVADAGGPYDAVADESVSLDGSDSYDSDGSIVSYEWDLDDDGVYDDATGLSTTYSWSSAGVYIVRLKVTDDNGASDTNSSTVTINTTNQPPVAEDDFYSLFEDGMLQISEPGVLSNDSDGDGDSLSANLFSSVSHGALVFYGNGSFIYSPSANYSGSDSFSYTVDDGSLESLPAVVTFTINPLNDAPQLVHINDYIISESETLTIDCSASDIDTAALSLQAEGLPCFGSFTDFSDGTGQFTFTPGFDDAGVYTIILNVTDGQLNDSTQFSLAVENTNRPPSQPYNPAPTNGSIVEAGPLCLSWAAEDPDDDLLSYNLYFGTTQNPELIQTGLGQETYCSIDVEPAQQYYWQIRSIDTSGAATFGPIWNFNTSYAAELEVHITVSSDGVNWSQNLSVLSGEEVFWNISVYNNGNSLLTNVLLLDSNGVSYGPFDLLSDEHRVFTYSTTVFEDYNNTVFASALDCTGQLIEEESFAYVHIISEDTIDIELCKSATLEYVSSADFEGFSHGFWKNHESEWVGYLPEDMTGDIFTIPQRLSGCNDTLHNALRFRGGNGVCKAAKLLMKQAVAGLLNAAHPDINYPLSESEIISLVDDALASENRNTLLRLKDTLDDYNNCRYDKCCKDRCCGGGSSEQIARITYTITVTNNGSIEANTIGILDLLPDGLSLVSWTANVGVFDVCTGIWTLDSLLAGDVGVLCLITETSASGLYLNIAELVYVDEVDVDSIPGNGDLLEDDMDCVQTEVQLDDAEYIDLELCLAASVEYVEQPCFEGFSHGFWKNHESEWVLYTPETQTGNVFDIPSQLSKADDSFHAALRFNGGAGLEKAAKLLMKQSVAALLNSAHPAINYPVSQEEIISSVNNALGSMNKKIMLNLKNRFDSYNNLHGDLEQEHSSCLITYTINLFNNGTIDATNIVVQETLPALADFVSSTSSLGFFDDANGQWVISSLESESSAHLVIKVYVNVTGSVENLVEVISADQSDVDSTPANGVSSEDDFDSIIIDVIVDYQDEDDDDEDDDDEDDDDEDDD